jgi:lipopolysaccharide export system permease protein
MNIILDKITFSIVFSGDSCFHRDYRFLVIRFFICLNLPKRFAFMAHVLSRYLTVSLSRYFCFMLLILLVVFSSLEIAHVLNNWFDQRFPLSWLFYSVAFEWPFLLVLLLPLSYYLSILCVFSLWTERREWLAMRVLGQRIRRFWLWIVLPAICLSLVVGLCAFVIQPRVLQMKQMIYHKLSAESTLRWLQPKHFNRLGQNWIIYPETKDLKSHQLHHVFAASEKSGSPNQHDRWDVLFADSARMQFDKDHYDLVFLDGHLYRGVPGSNRFRLLQFKSYAVQWVQEGDVDHLHHQADHLLTKELWQHRMKGPYFSVLFWRSSMVISTLMLAIFALVSLPLFVRHYRLTCSLHALVVVAYITGIIAQMHRFQITDQVVTASWFAALTPHLALLLVILFISNYEHLERFWYRYN